MPVKIDLRVLFISLVLLVCGVLSSFPLTYHITERMTTNISGYFRILFITTSPFSLDRYEHINYLHLFFHSLFFAGLLVYLFTAGRNTRLLGFALSIIFIDNLLIFTDQFVRLVIFIQEIIGFKYWWVIVLMTLKELAVLLASLFCLKWMGKSRFTPNYIYTEYGPGSLAEAEQYGFGLRLLHLIIDIVVSVLIFMKWVPLFARLFPGIDDNSKAEWIVRLILSFTMVVYYFVSEFFLYRTPAKFLTGVRVSGNLQTRAGAGKILLRSWVRLVPFEWISVFMGRLWHDDWSSTTLIKDKKLKEMEGNIATDGPEAKTFEESTE